ncbi:Ribophorin I [Gigaspora rosea]|uniref:Dolichyl-diphosphooligosaccharide--protein glycosyltransferase subunit 1 n=1 Tax=Gigaspora rosea TaxID=44941 RepID=A0A397UKU0_9GLOM|nr:Ribophorin I [Gigaspora rosea]
MRSCYNLALITLSICIIYNALVTADALPHVPQYWRNTNMVRTIDLSSYVVRESIAIASQNVHTEPVGEYYFPIPDGLSEHLAYIEVKEKKTDKVFEVEKVVSDSVNQTQYYKIYFDHRIDPQEKVLFIVKTAYIHELTPYPFEIAQTGRQNLIYRGNIYGNSAYYTEKQKTNVKLPTFNIIGYTQKPGSVSRSGNIITYGSFSNQEPGAFDELSIHYEFQQAILTVKGLRRDLEISHWGGNLAVEEHFNLTHDGAKLKGQFSRLEYQQTQYIHHETTMARDFSINLPAHASDVYYRDEIGNVSTSRLRNERDAKVLEFRPRYPLFGGWNYTWYHGYNVPLGDFLRYHKSGRYILNIPFVNPLHNAAFDHVQVRIILPEGASNVKVETPFPINKETHGVHKTYFDSKGRYLVVLDKFNVVDDHSKHFQVSYEYNSLELLRKPLVATTFFLCGFLLNMIFSRMEFTIGKKSNKD